MKTSVEEKRRGETQGEATVSLQAEWDEVATGHGMPGAPSGSRRPKGIPPDGTGSRALLTPGPGAAGLQNPERMHVCCFRPPGLWPHVKAAPGH